MLKRLRTLIWAVVLLGGALLAIRTFVGDIYRISSSSMAPVCLVDEFVFVLHDRSAPERHDLVVVRHGGEFLVKRAIGVGGALGESVRIDKGDLRVNGDKLGPLEPRPPMVPPVRRPSPEDRRPLPLQRAVEARHGLPYGVSTLRPGRA